MSHVIEVNCETGEVTERPLTAEELAANEVARTKAEFERVISETEEIAELSK
jgi:hypothetical protein